MSLDSIKLGVIGAGSMGSAIAQGLVAAGAMDAGRILVSGHANVRLASMAEKGFVTFTDNSQMLDLAPDVVILAVKPQVLPAVMKEHARQLAQKTVISIAAGTPTSTIEEALPGARVVRVMPNLCVEVLSGASAVAGGSSAGADDVALAAELFSALGKASVMREDQLEVEGAVVGTAPAYFAVFVDTLTRAAVKAGMPSAAARELLLATMAGSATQLLQSGEHPRAYAEKVTSPGGTTAAGLYELEPALFEGSFAAVDASLARAAELAGK